MRRMRRAALIALAFILLAMVPFASAKTVQKGDPILYNMQFTLLETDKYGTGIKYTPNCLVECHMPIEFKYGGISQPQAKAFNKTMLGWVMNRLNASDDIYVEKVMWLQKKVYSYPDVISEKSCTQITSPNGSVSQACDLTWKKIIRDVQEWEWVEWSQVSLDKDRVYAVDFVGRRTPKLGFYAADMIPSFFEFQVKEFAFWNSSYQNRRSFNASLNQVNESLWIDTGLVPGTDIRSDCADLAVTNGVDSNQAGEYNFAIGTMSESGCRTSGAVIYLLHNGTYTDGRLGYLYYNCASCADYRNETMLFINKTFSANETGWVSNSDSLSKWNVTGGVLYGSPDNSPNNYYSKNISLNMENNRRAGVMVKTLTTGGPNAGGTCFSGFSFPISPGFDNIYGVGYGGTGGGTSRIRHYTGDTAGPSVGSNIFMIMKSYWNGATAYLKAFSISSNEGIQGGWNASGTGTETTPGGVGFNSNNLQCYYDDFLVWNDTYEPNWYNASSTITLGSVEVSVPPQWSNCYANQTNLNEPANAGFQCSWRHSTESPAFNVSIIEHNFTGATFSNTTGNRTGNFSFANVTGIARNSYQWRFHANSSQGTLNTTDWFNITIGSPVGLGNLTIEAWSETNITRISQIRIVISNSSGNVTTRPYNNTFSFQSNEIPTGNITITVVNESITNSSRKFIARPYIVDFRNGISYNISAYLLGDNEGANMIIKVVDPQDTPIVGANVTIQTIIINESRTVHSEYTGGEGSITAFLNPNSPTPYTVIVSAAGYASKTVIIRQNDDGTTIKLGIANIPVFAPASVNVTTRISPNVQSVNMTNVTFDCFVRDYDEELTRFGWNITYNVSTLRHADNSTTLAAGGNFSEAVDLSGRWGNVTVTCFFEKTGFSQFAANRTFTIFNVTEAPVIILPAIITALGTINLSVLGQAFVAIISSVGAGGFFSRFNTMSGIIIGLGVLAMFTFALRWLDFGVFFFVAIATFGFAVWRGNA